VAEAHRVGFATFVAFIREREMTMPVLANAAGSQGMGGMLLTFGLMFAVMWFLIIRPQQKRQKEHQKMVAALKKGDRVITSGGLHGVVKEVRDETLLVKIAENTHVEVSRGAISTVKPAA
jgi:preprotein translocase subunit YajC